MEPLGRGPRRLRVAVQGGRRQGAAVEGQDRESGGWDGTGLVERRSKRLKHREVARGLLFGLAYLYTGSLVPGVLAHFLHNAKSFYGLWRER